ncbi:hypothetical protein SSIL_3278 [Solibacillus silvestris StLB046]|uniref:DUF8042 domain-containing protein n=1 Tax=Solibacillus silvestris (strain StLB046) TaxID=1002809 RepID=F2F313_SOLSS|nr:hypothetical protein [Solibacillus silvestris]BAK17701.1 hypothetical protein SSIL_3278 [Solibacillus silvestris StLB046]
MDYNEILIEYTDYVKRVPQGCVFIADSLREDRIDDALKAIHDFSEGVLWLSHISQLLQKENINVALNIQKIQQYLIEINEGLMKQDYVVVADMFEYEVEPFFSEMIVLDIKVQ